MLFIYGGGAFVCSRKGRTILWGKHIKAWSLILMIVMLTLGSCCIAQANNVATQTVTFFIADINELSNLAPVTLTINTATAGAMPDPATDSSTTYSITAKGKTKKITARIDTAMPTGLTLKVKLEAPTTGTGQTGATSLGDVTLSTTAKDVVRDIKNVKNESVGITYTLSPVGSTPPAPTAGVRTVTFTLMDQ